MGFDRYMELALYEPGLGYYAGGSTKFGGSGDFVTAPEISSLFGRALARQLAEVIAATRGDILELGPGTGALAADILTELDRLGVLPGRYRLLDVSAELRARQQGRLNGLAPELRDRVEWVDRLPDEIRGVVLGNEVLDALPVRLAEWTDDGVFERGVAWGTEGFRWARGGPCDGELALALQGIEVPPPYVTEVGLQARALVATLAERLHAGALILIDYGFGSGEFHHPQRSQGTLMCHYRHHAHGDPFHLPGLQDITAHVDFTAVATAGVSHGLSLAGYTTQAHFLVNCGITELLAEAAPSGAWSARSPDSPMGICPVCSEGSPPVPAGSRTHCRGARHVPICVPMHRSRPAALEFPPAMPLWSLGCDSCATRGSRPFLIRPFERTSLS